MEVEAILTELRYNRGRFPRKALVAAIERPAELAPHLIESIEYARRRGKELPYEYFLHIYAMLLLAQFRERAAYAPIVDFLTLPGTLAIDLTGDLVTESMQGILASVAHGEIEPMLGLVDRSDLDEFVRTAALWGIVSSHVAGEVSLERIDALFDELFEGRLERRPSWVWAAVVIACSDLSLVSFGPQIERAFDERLIDEFAVRRSEIVADLSTPTDPHRLRKYGRVDDTVAQMEWWACFEPEGSASARRDSPRQVGRNEPCPCGSGKKYKRCCLA